MTEEQIKIKITEKDYDDGLKFIRMGKNFLGIENMSVKELAGWIMKIGYFLSKLQAHLKFDVEVTKIKHIVYMLETHKVELLKKVFNVDSNGN